MNTRTIRRPRLLVVRLLAVAALVGATLGIGAGTVSAQPNCLTLSKGITMMLNAARISREGGYTEAANYKLETALYWESLYEEARCP